jgi:hypothetical protein
MTILTNYTTGRMSLASTPHPIGNVWLSSWFPDSSSLFYH